MQWYILYICTYNEIESRICGGKIYFLLTTGAPDVRDRLQGLLIKSLAPPFPGPPPHLLPPELQYLIPLPERIYPGQSQFNKSSLLLTEVIRTRSNIVWDLRWPRVIMCGNVRWRAERWADHAPDHGEMSTGRGERGTIITQHHYTPHLILISRHHQTLRENWLSA